VALQNMHLIFGFVESFAQGGKEGRKEGRMDNPPSEGSSLLLISL
jgi:hypothetical protein